MHADGDRVAGAVPGGRDALVQPPAREASEDLRPLGGGDLARGGVEPWRAEAFRVSTGPSWKRRSWTPCAAGECRETAALRRPRGFTRCGVRRRMRPRRCER